MRSEEKILEFCGLFDECFQFSVGITIEYSSTVNNVS